MTFADIHSHIIFGVDDGARDESEMYDIIDRAYRSGTRLLCCTPHFHPGYWGNNSAKVDDVYEQLIPTLKTKYPDLKVYLGNELRYAPESVAWLGNGACRTLGQTRLVLVDFADNDAEKYIESGVYTLLNAGYTPVLAHAERYKAFHGKISPLAAFKNNGIIIQADTQSLFRGFGFAVQRQCKKLLAAGAIDLFSSDTHNCTSRPPDMDSCFNYISKKYGAACAKALCRDNAVQMLCGEDS